MKKIILSMSFVAIGLAAFAQKPTGGNITTEIGFTSLLGAPSNPATLNIPQGMLRARYFLNEGMAVRVHLGFGSASTTTTQQTPAGVTPVISAENKTTTTGFGIALGIEKHLAGTDKLSPYLGGEIGFGSGSTKVEISNSNTPTGAPSAVGDKYSQSGGALTTIALNAFIGADYYVTEKVYFGAELGIGLFKMNKTGETDVESTTAGTTVKVTSPEAKGNSWGITPNVIGQVRLGIILF
jgi:hypothetical protein